ncbi:MAG: hypothetical protein QOJ19_491 [Acidimicrobiia bacterium]|nr:hypothetical protein [Acidimicrobiia bacterium]
MRRFIRPLAAVAMSAGLVVAAAGTASAHVTVNPNTATEGGYAKLTFRVPNEKSDADTVRLDVQLPLDHPIASLNVQPQAGWTYTVTKTTLDTPIKTDDGEITEAISQISWTGGVIKPGEFNEFSVSGGPLPSGVDALPIKALQTYSDGDVVRWIETSVPGQAAPEHPAPVLKLTPASAPSAAPTATPTAAAPTVPAASTADSSSSDGTARTLGIVGIVAGVAGLAAAGLGRRKRDDVPMPQAAAPRSRELEDSLTH